MEKLKNNNKGLIFIIGLAVAGVTIVISSFGFTTNTTKDRAITTEKTANIESLDLPSSLSFSGERVPLEDPDVFERLDRELLVNTYWQSNAIMLIKRGHKYFPIIEPILEEYGVPDDFKFLAMAESGFMQVVSPAGATGFWQLMKGTAKEYGLEVNSNVDERYNVEVSTHAACQYLLKSKEKFGSWTLAAAAYNAGNAGIMKQQKRQEVQNYYDLLLVEETSRYVFRILALKELYNNYEDYGFAIDTSHLYSPIQTSPIKVDYAIENLATFAKEQGISYKTLKRYNPWLRDNFLINNSGKEYVFQIPEASSYPIHTNNLREE